MNDNEKILNELGELFCLMVIVALLIIWCSYVFSVLWGWFVVPLGLPVLGVAHAAGLLLLIKFTKSTKPDGSKARLGVIASSATKSAFFVAALLGIGWIAHSFM